jgi:nitrogen regulatory protein PII
MRLKEGITVASPRRRDGSHMKMLIVVARESMLSELEELLRNNGINAYTILSNVQGKGVTGRVHGTFYHPDINSIIFSVLSGDQAQRAVNALTALHARSVSSSGQPVPLKVFTFPCEEHV